MHVFYIHLTSLLTSCCYYINLPLAPPSGAILKKNVNRLLIKSVIFFCLCLFFQSMPTDMCALQDFDEPDKLHIQVDDIITIIEGRWVIK